jgi:hypothetical protein
MSLFAIVVAVLFVALFSLCNDRRKASDLQIGRGSIDGVEFAEMLGKID